MQHPRLVVLALFALGTVSLLGAGTAAAQKKAVKPCGITGMPLSVGNSWTYEPTDYPAPTRGTDSEKEKEAKSREGAVKLYPNQAAKVVITVSAVETKDGVTTVKLNELVDERALETTLTCTSSTVTVSIDSFFYAGEPGGSWNLTWKDIERKGHTFPVVGGKISGTEWKDDFKAGWSREGTKDTGADLGSGTISIKRRMVMVAEEPAIESPAGSWAKSGKIGIETSGNVTIAGTGAKPYELPAGLVTYLYLVDGVGLARVENAFFHAYQLAAFTVAK